MAISRKILALLILTLVIALAACSSKKETGQKIDISSNIERPMTAIDRDSLFYGLTAEDSTTVFDLTSNNYMVEYDKMGDDYFVFAINTVDQGNDYFWVYAVNDTMGNVAANKKKIGPGDRVVWHYRLITR